MFTGEGGWCSHHEGAKNVEVNSGDVEVNSGLILGDVGHLSFSVNKHIPTNCSQQDFYYKFITDVLQMKL